METFSALLALCEGHSLVTGEFPSQKPVTRSFDVFFDLHLNKRLSKQSWSWWFATPSRPLWRHCYVLSTPDDNDAIGNTMPILRSSSHLGRGIVWVSRHVHTGSRGQSFRTPPQNISVSGKQRLQCTRREIHVTGDKYRMYLSLTRLHWTKWPSFCRRYLQMHFREWKVLYFD